jgi:hypothetical protein
MRAREALLLFLSSGFPHPALYLPLPKIEFYPHSKGVYKHNEPAVDRHRLTRRNYVIEAVWTSIDSWTHLWTVLVKELFCTILVV